MAIKPIKPTVPPAPSRVDPGVDFATKADAFAAFQAPFATYLDAVADFADAQADAAAAAASAAGATEGFDITGQAGNFYRVNLAGTALEFRTPLQVLADLGVTATAAELNAVDGVTTTGTSLIRAASSTAALGVLGVTATAAELNILDGVTATAAELNKLDGVTATTAELNKLAGTPAGLTATELGFVDGVTSAIQTQLNGKAPLPQSAAGVGQWVSLFANIGTALVLPAGGTWAYKATIYNSIGEYSSQVTGVAAGGTTLTGATEIKDGFCWRIA